MGKLFGTDGVRGIANADLTPELAFKLGRAGAYVLAREKGRPRFVVGKDTRISGDMLEAALSAGICSAGAEVLQVGVIPTPAVAYLTRTLGANGGVVISASHNPVEDNGIKFFSADGYKLPDELEEQIENLVKSADDRLPRPQGGGVGRIVRVEEAIGQYINFVLDTIDCDLRKLRIVVDCANGAASQITPRVLHRLGAEVIPINHQPNGVNINVNCGSTHPEALQTAVVEHRADVGIAHDGDADRMLAVDEKGNLVDGDQIMAICGLHLLRQGLLPANTIVATVMSNLGLHLAFRKAGGLVLTTKVGDRYVIEEMRKNDVVLGGEQSGHIIFSEYNTTGDGVITALQLLRVMRQTRKKLSELAAQMSKLPQEMINVRVKHKEKLAQDPEITQAVKQAEQELGESGRILIRPSGTEPIVRVMAEGEDREAIAAIARELADLVKRKLG